MKKLIFLPLLALLLLGAGCQKTAIQNTPSNTSTTEAPSRYPDGIYYRMPNENDPSAVLTHIGSSLEFTAQMSPVDYDISETQVVYPDDTELKLVGSDGKTRTMKVKGLYQMARPTFSHDGTRVAVQATTTKHAGGQGADPSELKIFVISLSDGEWQQISPASSLPNESPSWFNTANKVLYSTFSPVEGVDMHIYDLDQKSEVLTIQDAGWHGVAVSKDDTQIFVPNSMRVYRATTGELVADLKEKATTGIQQAGFTLTENVGDSHSPFLDSDWSSQLTQLVFDAVVMDHGEQHIVIFTMNVDGSDVKAVSEPIEVNPDFSNNHNFSQVNPVWL